MRPSRWSISALAVELAVDRRTCARRLEAAGIEPCGQDRGSPVYRLRDVVVPIVGPSITAGDDRNAEKRRLDAARADLAELELKRRRGDLLDADTVERTWAAVGGATRARVLAVPSAIAAQVADASTAEECYRVIETALLDALVEIADGTPSAIGSRRLDAEAESEPEA